MRRCPSSFGCRANECSRTRRVPVVAVCGLWLQGKPGCPRVGSRENRAAHACAADKALLPTRVLQTKPGCPRVGCRESSAAHAWAAEKTLLPTRGQQGFPCCPRPRAAWLRSSRCQRVPLFGLTVLRTHSSFRVSFSGVYLLLHAGRQSEVLSVLGVSEPALCAWCPSGSSTR